MQKEDKKFLQKDRRVDLSLKSIANSPSSTQSVIDYILESRKKAYFVSLGPAEDSPITFADLTWRNKSEGRTWAHGLAPTRHYVSRVNGPNPAGIIWEGEIGGIEEQSIIRALVVNESDSPVVWGLVVMVDV